MATIQEKIKGKKIVSFKIKACVGRDANGKQVFRCTTWYPPEELTNAKARKEAQKVAILWEDEAKQLYLIELEEGKLCLQVCIHRRQRTLYFLLPLRWRKNDHSHFIRLLIRDILVFLSCFDFEIIFCRSISKQHCAGSLCLLYRILLSHLRVLLFS